MTPGPTVRSQNGLVVADLRPAAEAGPDRSRGTLLDRIDIAGAKVTIDDVATQRVACQPPARGAHHLLTVATQIAPPPGHVGLLIGSFSGAQNAEVNFAGLPSTALRDQGRMRHIE